jgi:hypothetical protein
MMFGNAWLFQAARFRLRLILPLDLSRWMNPTAARRSVAVFFGAVVHSDSAFVFAKGHVQHPIHKAAYLCAALVSCPSSLPGSALFNCDLHLPKWSLLSFPKSGDFCHGRFGS